MVPWSNDLAWSEVVCEYIFLWPMCSPVSIFALSEKALALRLCNDECRTSVEAKYFVLFPGIFIQLLVSMTILFCSILVLVSIVLTIF